MRILNIKEHALHVKSLAHLIHIGCGNPALKQYQTVCGKFLTGQAYSAKVDIVLQLLNCLLQHRNTNLSQLCKFSRDGVDCSLGLGYIRLYGR